MYETFLDTSNKEGTYLIISRVVTDFEARVDFIFIFYRKKFSRLYSWEITRERKCLNGTCVKNSNRGERDGPCSPRRTRRMIHLPSSFILRYPFYTDGRHHSLRLLYVKIFMRKRAPTASGKRLGKISSLRRVVDRASSEARAPRLKKCPRLQLYVLKAI